jgi:hypothetical protein
MKKFLTFILFILIIFNISCNDQNTIERRNNAQSRDYIMMIMTSNKSDLQYKIYCDSLYMINSKEAFIWINGRKMKIYAETLIPYSNLEKKRK